MCAPIGLIALVFLAGVPITCANRHGDFYKQVLEMPASQRTPKSVEKTYLESRQMDFVESAAQAAERATAEVQRLKSEQRTPTKFNSAVRGQKSRKKKRNTGNGKKSSAPQDAERRDSSAPAPLVERSMQLDGVVVPAELEFPGDRRTPRQKPDGAKVNKK